MSDRFYQQQGGFKSKAQRRGYVGITPLRKKLRKMPAFITEGVRKEVKNLAKEVEMDAIGLAFIKDINLTTEMILSISYKIGGRKGTADEGLTAVIGPGADKGAWQGVAFDTSSARFQKLSIKQKNARWQFMKGYWAEFGTEQHPMERPFMNEAWEANYPKYKIKINAKIDRALELGADFY